MDKKNTVFNFFLFAVLIVSFGLLCANNFYLVSIYRDLNVKQKPSAESVKTVAGSDEAAVVAETPVDIAEDMFEAKDVWEQMDNMRHKMDELFDDQMEAFFNVDSDELEFADDNSFSEKIFEEDNAYIIELSLPGFDMDSVTAAVSDNVLSLSGTRAEEQTEDNEEGYSRILSKGEFKRTFGLPADANIGALSVNKDAGTVVITVPKK